MDVSITYEKKKKMVLIIGEFVKNNLLYEICCCQTDLLHFDNQCFTFMTNYAFQGVVHVQSTF